MSLTTKAEDKAAPLPAGVIPKVLIVDDGKEITDLIYNYSMYYKRDFTTLVTNRPEEVLQILDANEEVRIVVTDFRMPSLNGLELFFQVRAKYPWMQFIMMTGFGTPELRSKAERGGFLRYLEKPFRIVELIKAIRACLDTQARGFQGYVPSLELSDIIQLLAMSGGEAALEISAGDRNGRLCFRAGELVHAEVGDVVGPKAFFELALWKSGEFIVSDLSAGVERTIEDSWQGLLIEAARITDELNATLDDAERTHEVETTDGWRGEVRSESLMQAERVAPQRSPEPASSPPAQPPAKTIAPIPAQMGELGLSDLELALARISDTVEGYLPPNANELFVKSLPLKQLPLTVRRHLTLHFHWLTTSVFRIEEGPFDWKDERVAKAAVEMLDALLDSWKMSRQEFLEVIREIARFHLARALHPAAALSEYLTTTARGDTRRMIQIMEAMIEKEVLPGDCRPLIGWLGQFGSSQIDAEDVERGVRECLAGMDREALTAELINSARLLLALASFGVNKPLKTLQREILLAMLDARDQEDWARALRRLPGGLRVAIVPEQIKFNVQDM